MEGFAVIVKDRMKKRKRKVRKSYFGQNIDKNYVPEIKHTPNGLRQRKTKKVILKTQINLNMTYKT